MRLALTLPLLCASLSAHAGPVAWVDWTGVDGANNILGQINVDGATVQLTYTGERAFYQANGGPNYFIPSASYVSATVDNPPPNSDIIALHLASPKLLTFSQPVTNPLFAVVSLNGNGYRFDRDFEILSFGAGYWGNGTLTRTVTTHPDGSVTYDLIGSGEPHGVLQFIGTFETISWVSLSNENWNGFTIAVENLAAAVPPEIAVFEGADSGAPELFTGQAVGDFGNLSFGELATRTLTLANQGTGPLNFEAISFSGVGAEAFSASSLPPAIAAGDERTLELSFAPVVAGPYEVLLSIPSDDQDEPVFELWLTGALDDDDRDGVLDDDDLCPGADDALDGDGDAVPDGCDLCLGDDLSGDADADGLCADRDFHLEVGAISPGSSFSVRVLRAPPGAQLTLVGSQTGEGPLRCVAGSEVCVSLANPTVLRRGVADNTGSLAGAVMAPVGLQAAWFQVFWYDPTTGAGDVTPVVEAQVVQPAQ
jgi:hypothetical protein